MIRFKNSDHEERYNEVLGMMRKHDRYHQSAAYLIALDNALYNNKNKVFDFEKDEINLFGALYQPWQTGTSVKTTRLMFNLWNSAKVDYDERESAEDITTGLYTVDEIFSSGLALWYFEAVKLRFPEYIKDR